MHKILKTLVAGNPFDVVNFQIHASYLRSADEGVPCCSPFKIVSAGKSDNSEIASDV